MSTSTVTTDRIAQRPVSSPADAAASGRSELRAGAREMLPFVIGYVPFALLVGVSVARSADPLAGWSGTVPLYGGSAQLTLLELMAGGAAVWAAAGAALLVNTRLLVYSAALMPLFGSARLRTRLLAAAFIVDPTWFIAIRRAERPGGLADRRHHYAGAVLALTVGWVTVITVGVLLGRVDTPVLAVVGPLCLASLVVPHLRLPGGVAAVLAAVAVTLAASVLALPPGVGTITAMGAAALAGALSGKGAGR